MVENLLSKIYIEGALMSKFRNIALSRESDISVVPGCNTVEPRHNHVPYIV